MTIDQSEARRWVIRLLEENCENPEFCLVYEEEEIIDEAATSDTINLEGLQPLHTPSS